MKKEFKDLLAALFLNKPRDKIEEKFSKSFYRDNHLLIERQKLGSLDKFSQFLNQIKEHLGNKTGLLLEVGCGFGLHALFWSHSGYKVCAFDVSRQTISVFNVILNEYNKETPCYPLTSDALNIPLPTQSTDIIYANEFISHVPDLSQSLREFARILRPGGELIISDTDKRSLFSFVIWPRQKRAEKRYAEMRKTIIREFLERQHLTLTNKEINHVISETIGLTKKEIEQVTQLFVKTRIIKLFVNKLKLREPFNSEFKYRSPYGQYNERLFTPKQVSSLLQNNFDIIHIFYPIVCSPFAHLISFKIIRPLDRLLPTSIPLLSAMLVGKYVIICRRKNAAFRDTNKEYTPQPCKKS